MSIKVTEDGHLPDDPTPNPTKKDSQLLIVIFLIIVLGSGYMMRPSTKEINESPYQLGARFDREKFMNSPQYVPILRGTSNLPVSSSIKGRTPKPGDQGKLGSCVGWASAYAALSALFGENMMAFSPSYLFNQIALENCEGSFLSDAMAILKKNGGLPIEDFPYSDEGCGIPPTQEEINSGKSFAISDFQRLTNRAGVVSMKMIKEHLANENPVVIGMQVPGSFIWEMNGKDVWRPKDEDDFSYGGHALTVIGYDDEKYGGAFEVINSWTTNWGNGGYTWITYPDFFEYVVQAYALMGNNEVVPVEKIRIAANISLVKKTKSIQDQNLIDLQYRIQLKQENPYFQTNTLNKGECFKILFENPEPIFFYVFARDHESGIKVIFPYAQNHSADLSTPGLRAFPDNYSFCLDELGDSEELVVLISKDEWKFNSIVEAANAVRGTFFERMTKTLNGIASLPKKANISQNSLVINQELDGGENSVLIPLRVLKR